MALACELLKQLEYTCIKGSVDREVGALVYDSRKIEKGCIFVFIEGTKTDGHSFAVEAAGRIQNAKAAMEVATKQIPILQCLQRSFHAGSAQEMAIQNVLNVFLEVTWTQTIS